MKKRALTAVSAALLTVTLTASPALAGHTTDTSVPTPRSVVCKWLPFFCN